MPRKRKKELPVKPGSITSSYVFSYPTVVVTSIFSDGSRVLREREVRAYQHIYLEPGEFLLSVGFRG